jgi:Flp pilus assembly protein TadB
MRDSPIEWISALTGGALVLRRAGLRSTERAEASKGVRTATMAGKRDLPAGRRDRNVVTRLVEGLVGAPPPPDASRAARLRWIRGFYFRTAPLTLAICVLACLWLSATSIFVLLMLLLGLGLWSVISLTLKIRREERRAP